MKCRPDVRLDMANSDHYGWTCRECPSRGSRETVGDFVGIAYHHREETPVEGLPAVVDRISEIRYRTESVGYPDRCTVCNERYQRHKRAREAGHRLDMVRMHQQQTHMWKHGGEGARWKHLKFITMTWPSQWTTESTPDLKAFKKMFATARGAIAQAIGAIGGTDVVEVITQEMDTMWGGKMWKHHVHTHGLWCAPFVPIDMLQKAFSDAGVGRFEYTILEEEKWEDSSGKERTKKSINVAVDYLAKYLTKAKGQKRMVWGELRSWKEYLPKHKCRVCIKTTSDAEKYQNCKCKDKTNGGRS